MLDSGPKDQTIVDGGRAKRRPRCQRPNDHLALKAQPKPEHRNVRCVACRFPAK
jgi:hypothetical protein